MKKNPRSKPRRYELRGIQEQPKTSIYYDSKLYLVITQHTKRGGTVSVRFGGVDAVSRLIALLKDKIAPWENKAP